MAVAVGVLWLLARPRGSVRAVPVATLPSPSATPARAVPSPAATAAARGVPAPQPTVTPAPPPWTPTQLRRLHAALGGALAPAIDGAQGWSLIVLDAAGRPIYRNHASQSAAPASTQKLIVASSALHDLGPEYRFPTLLAGLAPIGADGTLRGNLWFVGSGDPSFRARDLKRGVDALAAAGLRRVSGGVAVDASAMQGEEINPHWNPADANEDFQSPISAVSIDEDTVEFDVTGRLAGETARVRIRPSSRAVTTSGSIQTGGGDDVIIAADELPNAFTLEGNIPPGVTEKFWVPVHGMPRYVGAVLQHMLRRRSITTGAPPSVEAAPLATVVLWEHRSKPLRMLEHHMLVVSDNHYAEQLLRAVGAATGYGATDAGGIRAERAFLAHAGIATPHIRLLDGSGLSRGNRVAAITLAEILSYSERRGGGAELRRLLPAGGRQGTLVYYDFTTALGRVRAKTGHIDGVSSLAGYVDTYHHGRVVFAFLINGSPGDPDIAIVHAIDRLVEF